MVEQSVPWPTGTPNWVDLAADDTGAAAEFLTPASSAGTASSRAGATTGSAS